MAIRLRAKALILLLLSSVRAGADERDRPVLYALYGTDILVRLQRIQAHAERDSPRGVLIAALKSRTPGYVQCRFVEAGRVLVCEAIAAAYPARASDQATLQVQEKLYKAGYRRDTTGRALFRYQITDDSGTWGGAAVTILKPLIDVFGARATSRIDIIAPLAPERDEAAIQRELMR